MQPQARALHSLSPERVAGPSAPAAIAGVEYLRAESFAAKFGLRAEASGDGKSLTLKSPSTTIVFEHGRHEIAFNGLRIFLGEAVQKKGTQFLIAQLDADKVLVPLLLPGYGLGNGSGGDGTHGELPELRTIVIDPGHGGRDPGKVNAKLSINEKAMTLDTAQRLQRLLEARGYRVLLTRTADVALDADKNTDLRARAHFANEHGADLFISLHYNAVGGSAERMQRVHGVEVYTLTPQHQYSQSDTERRETAAAAVALPGNAHDHWNMIIAHEVQRGLVKSLGAADRGVKRARFAVLREVACPAILVEAGFLSHDQEARKVATPEYRQQIAESIASSIIMYDAALEGIHRARQAATAVATPAQSMSAPPVSPTG